VWKPGCLASKPLFYRVLRLSQDSARFIQENVTCIQELDPLFGPVKQWKSQLLFKLLDLLA